MESSGIKKEQIAAVGITNQRESTVAWDRATGVACCNAIVWDDIRTAALVPQYKDAFNFSEVTGIGVNTYISAPKIAWMIQNGCVTVGPNTAFGTVDSWLIYNLTKERNFYIEISNASRMGLMSLAGEW
jgi:glycerol kinase